MQEKTPPPSPFTLLTMLAGIVVLLLAVLEVASKRLLVSEAETGGFAPAQERLVRLVNGYLDVRESVVSWWWVVLPAIVLAPYLLFRMYGRCARWSSERREKSSGMELTVSDPTLKSPFGATPELACKPAMDALANAIFANPEPDSQVVLGFTDKAAPVYVSDKARATHMQCLGFTGSGKTESVLFPLLFQDARRGRVCVLVDAKGDINNEDMLAQIAAATGRAGKLFVFTLNPERTSHTYNPLHLGERGDPRAVAERVFATLEPTMDVPYYKDMARFLWLHLVQAFASTGKPFHIRDVWAAIADLDVMDVGLRQASDKGCVRAIHNELNRLGRDVHKSYQGLLAALDRYHHPALEVYNPDMILEELLENGGIVGWSLNVNAYPLATPAIGQLVMRHIQQIGANRQQRREKSEYVYVYMDEFSNLAYEGFVDAVNKLRSARISMFLAHQSWADLTKVSPEFATGIFDNTRNTLCLFQNDPAFCDLLAGSIGTQGAIGLTTRRSVDGFLNQHSMLEASARATEEYILHPNQIKKLWGMGQAYLVQKGVNDTPPPNRRWWSPLRAAEPFAPTRAVGLNLGMLKKLPDAVLPVPGPRDTTTGLGLANLFAIGSAA